MLMSLPMLRRTKDSSKVSSKCRHLGNLDNTRLLGKAFSWVVPGRLLGSLWGFAITKKGCD